MQSRYYDPEIGIFLNADAFASTGQGILGNNMFAYCNNSPITLIDSLGTIPELVDLTPEDDHQEMMEKDLGPVSTGGNNSAGNSSSIVLYRAVSANEYSSLVQSGRFSQSGSSVDGKYFATTYENAQTWGRRFYQDGPYHVITAVFSNKILGTSNHMYWNNLDAIGPAYFFEIGATNAYMIKLF